MHPPQPLKGCTVCCYCSSSSLSLPWKAQSGSSWWKTPAEFPAGHRDGHIPKISGGLGPFLGGLGEGKGLSIPGEPLGVVPVLLGMSQMSQGMGTEFSSGICCLDILWGVWPGAENVPVVQPGDETQRKRALELSREREKNPGIRAGSKGLVTCSEILTGVCFSQCSH